MKRIIALSLAAGCLAWTAPALLAQTATNAPAQNQTQAPNLRGMTREQRQEFLRNHPAVARQMQQRREMMKMLGLNPKDLKDLTPAERRAKIKAAAEQKVAELEKKKADGTITEQEQSALALLEKRLQHAHAKPPTDN